MLREKEQRYLERAQQTTTVSIELPRPKQICPAAKGPGSSIQGAWTAPGLQGESCRTTSAEKGPGLFRWRVSLGGLGGRHT